MWALDMLGPCSTALLVADATGGSTAGFLAPYPDIFGIIVISSIIIVGGISYEPISIAIFHCNRSCRVSYNVICKTYVKHRVLATRWLTPSDIKVPFVRENSDMRTFYFNSIKYLLFSSSSNRKQFRP